MIEVKVYRRTKENRQICRDNGMRLVCFFKMRRGFAFSGYWFGINFQLKDKIPVRNLLNEKLFDDGIPF